MYRNPIRLRRRHERKVRRRIERGNRAMTAFIKEFRKRIQGSWDVHFTDSVWTMLPELSTFQQDGRQIVASVRDTES